MNMPSAYEGKHPYIFVSYAHLDSDEVLPILSELESRGFRVWYDGGIEAGTEWPEYIATHLDGCEAVLALISEHALQSHNCRREINFAIELKKPMLVIYLRDVEMSLGMRMQLGTLQALFRNRHNSMESFMESLCQCSILLPCGDNDAQRTLPEREETDFWHKPLAKYDRETLQDFETAKAKAREGDFAEALEYYKLASEKCHVQAQYEVGMAYWEGRGTKADMEQAVTWLEMAAMQDHVEAQFMLGTIYDRYKSDRKNAFMWYSKASDQGHSGAMKALAYLYGSGLEGKKDLAAMAQLYLRTAQAGDPGAQTSLGRCYFKGEGVEKDPREAVKWWTLAAKSGDCNAQYELGTCLEEGIGIEKNLQEAVQWYRRSAVQGSAWARYRLGRCYEFGIGVEKDEKEAGKWFAQTEYMLYDIELTWDELDMASSQTAQWHYEEAVRLEKEKVRDYDAPENYYIAAKRGHLQAQKRLAELYEFGMLCLDVDLKDAAYWYGKAANQGDAEAQYDLYLCYQHGKGVEKNLQEAVRWLKLSANGGYADAMAALGWHFAAGKGVSKNEAEAFDWYQKAAEHGCASALNSLAECYEKGIGVKKNKLKANYYLHKYKKR